MPGFCREGKWEVPQDPLLAQVKQADLQKVIANLFHPPDGNYSDKLMCI
ncbi:MAG: hypothetical protein AB4038_08970 [Prochloraceae cyanobacterium]